MMQIIQFTTHILEVPKSIALPVSINQPVKNKIFKPRPQLLCNEEQPFNLTRKNTIQADNKIISIISLEKIDLSLSGFDTASCEREKPLKQRIHNLLRSTGPVLQFKRNGDAYLYDLGSTHGTFINKNQVSEKSLFIFKLYAFLKRSDVSDTLILSRELLMCDPSHVIQYISGYISNLLI
ncbi:hypothetical protein NC652_038375 [Populus alba x Populus x berolinensis]|nr:hypothetical protein NC652_038375 [Populus alba x Populus x berolinensis]